ETDLEATLFGTDRGCPNLTPLFSQIGNPSLLSVEATKLETNLTLIENQNGAICSNISSCSKPFQQNVRKKQRPLTASLQCNSTAQTEKVSVIQDFVKMCLEANIPLEKADHPAVRAFLSRHVKNGGSIPKSDQLRRAYLPDGYENENQLLNSQDC
uniref:CGG triplet repeat binding protein 1 n=1 Tax=Monodelphis domestica TaxID=13616 RepID=A0A5F8HC29_MONDO